MNEYEKFRIEQLKKILDEEKIEYIEDELRILISLEKLYTVEGILSVHEWNILDEVIDDDIFGGDNKHYYLIAKSKKTPVINYQSIKNREITDVFHNTVYLKDFVSNEDGSGYATDSYIKRCIGQRKYEDDSDYGYSDYLKIIIKDAILC